MQIDDDNPKQRRYDRETGLLVVDDFFLVIMFKGNDQTEQTQLL
jgi:hypothetical protein